MMQNKITIAIDGYSSTGKSTVAKQLAKELGYVYVDTGAMYRAVTLYAMRNNLVDENNLDTAAILQELPQLQIKFVFNEHLGYGEVYLNNENVEKNIRGLQVSQQVSKIAAIPEVRKMLVKIQKQIGEQKAVVMDGRDIGTVVFPTAELKLFMTASEKTRATRRFKELKENNQEVNYQAILENVKERDHLDTTRQDSPLKKAEDAIEIDNSEMSREEQFQKILALAQKAIEKAH